MARRRTRVPLDVYLNSRPVGRLRRMANGAIDFQYAPSWLDWEHALPISTSLPLREDRYGGDAVLVVLDNLLPDSEPIRRRVAERVRAEGYDAYSLLARVGRDCAGALQFLPEGQEPGRAGMLDGHEVDDREIARRIRNLARAPLGVDTDEEFRISIAGMQEKTALLRWKEKWYLPRGSTATTHIVKPRIGVLPNGVDWSRSVENEHLCLRLAAALGLPVATTEIVEFDGERVLVIERFDRRWTKDGRLLRLPQEDFCQALSVPPTLKYQSDGGPGMVDLLELLKGSDEPEVDRRMFVKAQIAFWLLGATDGHAKNYSIFLRPGGRFALTPFYDIVSAQPAADARQLRRKEFRFALSVGDNRHYVMEGILPRHFAQTAARAGMPPPALREICVELVDAAEASIAATLESMPGDFPAELADSVTGGIRARVRRIEAFLA